MGLYEVVLERIQIFPVFGEEKNWQKFSKFQIFATVELNQHLSISDIFDTCVCNLGPRSFLVFLVFRPFPERLSCFGQDGHTGGSLRAGSRWSTSTSMRDVAACAKSSDEAARRESLLCYSPLARVTQRLACLQATPDGGDSDLPNEICDIANCVVIYYEKDVRAEMPSFGKKSSEPRFQGKWRRWKL